MKANQFLVLALSLAAASSTQLTCQYKIVYSYDGPEYVCTGDMTTAKADYLIDAVTGSHVDGLENDNVTAIVFKDQSMEILPRNLKTYFKDYAQLNIVNIDKLGSFQRSDFYDFTYLTYFAASNMTSINKLPRDTFFDLTKLDSLFLDFNPNLENLHEDLLMNLRLLTVFSARGPNKVNQINPGFFRNQADTLTVADFRDTQLVRIGHSVFVNLQIIFSGFFENSGCLNGVYYKEMITDVVRKQCQDVTL